MTKYHISSSGDPKKCTAEVRGCPLGGAAEHYDSPEAGYAAVEHMMKDFAPGAARELELELEGGGGSYEDLEATRQEFAAAQEEALKLAAEGKFATVVQVSSQFSHEYSELAYENEPDEDDEDAYGDWDEEVFSMERNFELGDHNNSKISTTFTVVTFESAFDFRKTLNGSIEAAHENASFYYYPDQDNVSNVTSSSVERNLDNDYFEQSRIYLYPPS